MCVLHFILPFLMSNVIGLQNKMFFILEKFQDFLKCFTIFLRYIKIYFKVEAPERLLALGFQAHCAIHFV